VPQTRSRSVERLGSQRPTWLALPSDGFDSGAGDEAIELAALAGLDLDDWQQFLLRASLMERKPGKWAAFSVDWWMGRQNGKGTGLEARQLYGLVVLKTKLSIHTAHQVKTTGEHFLRMQQLIEGCPDIERQVMRIRTGKGDEAIEMRSGCRQRFLSRADGSGRGFAGVDDLYLDEAMFLADGMMRSIFSTMAARSKSGNPQMWITGSAPYADKEPQSWAHGRVCAMREKAPSNAFFADFGTLPPSAEELHAAGSVDAWVESIVQDRDRWYGSNPALGIRISEEFCEQELATLGPLGFAVERLGLVIPADADNKSGIDLDAWDAAKRDGWSVDPGATVAVDVDETGSRGTVVAAQMIDGRPHVEIVEQGGVGKLVDWLCRQDRGVIGALVFDKASNGAMVPTLLAAHPDGADLAGRCVPVKDPTGAHVAFVTSLPVHRGDPRLRAAILAAEQRPVGDRWRWSRRASHGDPTALIATAFACAHIGAAVPDAPLFAY